MAFTTKGGYNDINHKKLLNDMLFSEEELAEFFACYFASLRVPVQDLKAPKADRVFSIYVSILKDFGISTDHMNQAPLALKDNGLVASQDDAIFLINFNCIMKNVLSCAGFHDLSKKDFTDPRPKKTRLIISILKNMWEYMNIKFNKYMSNKEEMVKEAEQLKENVKKVEGYRRNINMQKMRIAEKQPQIEQLKKIMQPMQQEMNEKLQFKEEIVAKLDQEKATSAELNAELANLKLKSVEFQEREQELDNKIVQSPEKETKIIQMMQEEEINKRNNLGKVRGKLYESEKVKEKFSKMTRELNSAIENMKSWQTTVENLMEIQVKVEDNRKYQDNKQEELEKQQNEAKRLNRLLTIKEESINKLRIQQSRKQAGIRDNIEQLQKDLQVMKEQQSQCSEVKNQQIETLMEIEKRIAEGEDGLTNINDAIQSQYAELLQKVEAVHSDVLLKLEEKKASMLQ